MGMKSLAWKSRYWFSFEGFRHYGHSNWLLHYFGLNFEKTLRRKNHFPPQPHMLWHSRKIQEENLTLKNEQLAQDSKWKANVRVNGKNVEVDLGSEMPLFHDVSQPIRKKMTSKHRKNEKRQHSHRGKAIQLLKTRL